MTAVDDLLGVDSDELLTPAQIEKRQRRVARRLLEATKEQQDAGQKSASAEADYRRQYAVTFVQTDGPMDLRAQVAAQAANEALGEREARREMSRSLAIECQALRDVLTTLASMQRTTRELAG